MDNWAVSIGTAENAEDVLSAKQDLWKKGYSTLEEAFLNLLSVLNQMVFRGINIDASVLKKVCWAKNEFIFLE